ncbi:MAG TPA: FtsQ-type POTRA domain-containing protein [Hanamia sp.]|nr:FtsQ-type POTRA domain-containing protein [Hanamia sp.]
MGNNKKYTFRKILVVSVWILLITGTVVLLIAAMSKKNEERIAGVEIKIAGVQNNYFISKKDVLDILEKVNGGKLNKSVVNSLDLTEMENRLEKDQWIKKAEIFYDNNNVLQVKITEREPVARIFTISGASFYIDSSLTRLPLSDKFSARLPVFTGFPTEVRVLKKQDSLLLNEVKILSEYIGSHPFWMAQIDQIDITPVADFEMIPKLGNQVIRFGDANNYQEKFNKLLAFYKQVQTSVGWNKYAVLDIRFRNQVIGINRNAAEIKSDSLRSIQIMKNLIEEAKKNSNDSTKIQLPAASDDNERVNNSPVLDNVPDETMNNATPEVKVSGTNVKHAIPIPNEKSKKSNTPEKKTVTRHSSSNEKPQPKEQKKGPVKKPVIKKQIEKPKEETNRVPKAVMPSKSDY